MIRSPETTRALGALLTTVSALLVVTCASTQPPAAARSRARPSSPEPAPKPPVATPPAPADAAAGPAPDATSSAAAVEEASGELSHFFTALDELARKEREEHVRVLWLGDSHTAADFFPNALREPLQKRFGVGGPGFVFVGLNIYRHDDLRFEREGRWRRQPRSPSYWKRQGDGVYGLGGMRTIPLTPVSSATLELEPEAVAGRALWELTYRVREGDSFRVSVDGGDRRRVTVETSESNAYGLSRLSFETEPGAQMIIDRARGEPELFGAVIESSEPGVVVDTLGINGARIGTPVAWDEDAWVAEAKRRSPELAVIAYGTNEVGDMVAPWRYETEYVTLVERIRRAAPDADCLIVGPTDRATPAWTTHQRVRPIEAVQQRAAAQLGCAFVSAVDLMGGDNSLKDWAEASPPLASNDRVHLTPKGYQKLGGDIANELFERYAAHSR